MFFVIRIGYFFFIKINWDQNQKNLNKDIVFFFFFNVLKLFYRQALLRIERQVQISVHVLVLSYLSSKS